MSEQIQGTPAAANNPQGTGPAPEQPQPTAPNPAQPSPQPNPPAASPAPTAPDVTALQQRLEQAEKAARHYQSQFSQARNQLQAVTGVQPQVDPLADDIEYLRKKGYDEQNARDMAEFMARKLQPLQQRNQQLESVVQGSAQVDAVMQAAMQQDAGLFQDERVRQEVYDHLKQVALSGNNQNLDPRYAIAYGDSVWGSIHRRAMQAPNPNPQQPPPAPRPFSMSWNGPQGGYVPAPAPGPRQAQPNSYDAELAERFNIKKQ